jgi:TldD protein
MQAWRARGGHGLYLPIDPVESLDDDAKVRLLETIDREARALDPRISQVMASLSASHDTILVLASDGTLAADVRPLVRLNVSVIIEQDGRREQGYAGGGGRFAYTEFLAQDRWRELVREAVDPCMCPWPGHDFHFSLTSADCASALVPELNPARSQNNRATKAMSFVAANK